MRCHTYATVYPVHTTVYTTVYPRLLCFTEILLRVIMPLRTALH